MAQTTPLQRFFAPPTADELSAMAAICLDHLPVVVRDMLGDLVLRIDEFPDDELIEEMDLESPYDLLSYGRAMESTETGHEPLLVILYRRPILEYWCEVGEDLMQIMAQVILDEIGHFLDLSDDTLEQIGAL